MAKCIKWFSCLLAAAMVVVALPPVIFAAGPLPLTLGVGDRYAVEVNTTAGQYYLYAEYMPLEGYGEDLTATVYVNGEKLDALYTFDRLYQNDLADGAAFETNPKGDHITPIQKQLFQRTAISFDNEAELLLLADGPQRIEISMTEEGIELYELAVRPYAEPPAYAEYIAAHGGAPVGKKVVIEGEGAALKSDGSLYPISDKASADTSPSSARHELLNTIGGSTWRKSGQWLQWDFSVPEDGLYEFSFRFRQNANVGMNSYRRVFIDDETPFRELLAVGFENSNSWQKQTLGDGNGAYYVYLTAGDHTLKMEVVAGQYRPLVDSARVLLNELNALYRDIIAITGAEPDIYRDYSIKDVAPDILDGLKTYSVALAELEKQLVAVTDATNEGSSILRQLADRMEKMADKHREIAKNLGDFKSGLSSMGTWINNMDNLPLEIDYVVLGNEDGEIFKKVGFFGRIGYAIERFVDTFIRDYDAIHAQYDEVVTVWIGTGNIAGIDQMKILNNLISNQFQDTYGVGVNLKLTAAGALLSATLAGIGPDVALQIAGSTPVDYGLRNALVDLREFPDIGEVLERFHHSAYDPFTIEGKLYALPETQSYSMLFYRKDILQSLGVDPSSLRTWKDIWQGVLPELQRQYMDFGFAPSLDNYLTLLYQKGGDLYLDGGRRSGLATEQAVEAFSEFTTLYDSYGLPIAFDFLNRFRTGEMPMAVADFTVYNQLCVFAPEIKDLWAMTTLPGTYDGDGHLVTTGVAGSMGCVIMADSQHKEAAWDFVKWWTDEQAQYEFGHRLEEMLGDAARYPTANLAAFSRIKWGAENRSVLARQRENIDSIDQVAGGYITARFFEFSFRDVVYDGKDARETLSSAVRKIDHEIALKREEFDLDN